MYISRGGNDYGWSSAVIIILLIITSILLLTLLYVENRSRDPIVPLHLFKVRNFRVAAVVTFIMGISMFSVISFLPLYFQVHTHTHTHTHTHFIIFSNQ
jgi:predicted MFS family arabinose efflux permease